MEINLKDIDLFIEENKENILRDIARLVAVPSIEGEPEENAPFGAGTGFVAFADGSVRKYANLLSDEDQFRSADGKRSSENYQDAIGANGANSGLVPTVLEDSI